MGSGYRIAQYIRRQNSTYNFKQHTMTVQFSTKQHCTAYIIQHAKYWAVQYSSYNTEHYNRVQQSTEVEISMYLCLNWNMIFRLLHVLTFNTSQNTISISYELNYDILFTQMTNPVTPISIIIIYLNYHVPGMKEINIILFIYFNY